MVAKVAHAREAFPKEVAFAADLHGRYDTTSGKRLTKAMEPFRLLWLEEPVPAENVDAIRQLRGLSHHAGLLRRKPFPAARLREVLEKRAGTTRLRAAERDVAGRDAGRDALPGRAGREIEPTAWWPSVGARA